MLPHLDEPHLPKRPHLLGLGQRVPIRLRLQLPLGPSLPLLQRRRRNRTRYEACTFRQFGLRKRLVEPAHGVDLDAGIVHVTQAIDRELDPDTGEYRVIDPKSASSRRHVPISAATVNAMREHRMATGRPADGELVWAQEDGRPSAAGGKPGSAWRRVTKAAGVQGLRPHDLRHNFATHALASGTRSHVTADLLGHADAGLVERRYGHSTSNELAAAPGKLEAWRASQRGARADATSPG